MGQLGFLTRVILGSAVAAAGVLTVALVVFLAVSIDHRALLEGYRALLGAVLVFAGLAAVAAAAFAGLQQRRRWRWIAQAAMWLTLVAIGWFYWPQAVD